MEAEPEKPLTVVQSLLYGEWDEDVQQLRCEWGHITFDQSTTGLHSHATVGMRRCWYSACCFPLWCQSALWETLRQQHQPQEDRPSALCIATTHKFVLCTASLKTSFYSLFFILSNLSETCHSLPVYFQHCVFIKPGKAGESHNVTQVRIYFLVKLQHENKLGWYKLTCVFTIMFHSV